MAVTQRMCAISTIVCSATNMPLLHCGRKRRYAMDDFIRRENVKLYRKALSESSDGEQRKVLLMLLRLLLAEEAALRKLAQPI
jgi:hypothetical protein